MTNVITLNPSTRTVDWDSELEHFVSDVFRDSDYFTDLASDWSFPEPDDAKEWLRRSCANVLLAGDRTILSDMLYPLRDLFLVEAKTDIAYFRDEQCYWRAATVAQLKDFIARWLTAIGRRAFSIDGVPTLKSQLENRVRDALDHLRAHAGLPEGWSSTLARRRARPARFTAFACGTLVMVTDGARVTDTAQPDDYVLRSEVLPVRYDPTIEAPASFDRLLRLMFSSRAERDTDPDSYLARLWTAAFPALGLQLPRPTLIVVKGPGGDGKSLLFGRVVRTLVGDSAFEQMGANTLATVGSERTSSGNYDLASFEGKRVVLADDTQQSVIGDTILKQLVAGSQAPAKVKTRAIYSAARMIDVSWQLVLCTNTDPRLTIAENGIERRLAMIEIEGLEHSRLEALLSDPATRAKGEEYAAGYLLSLPEDVRNGWVQDPQQLMGIWNLFADVVASFDVELMREPNRLARDRMGSSLLDQYAPAMFTSATITRDNYCRLSKARNIVRGALRLAFGGAAKSFSDSQVDDRLRQMGIAIAKNEHIRGQTADILRGHIAGPLAELFIRYGKDEPVREELETALENVGSGQSYLSAIDLLISLARPARPTDQLTKLGRFIDQNPNAIALPLHDAVTLMTLAGASAEGETFVRERLSGGSYSDASLRFVLDELLKQYGRKYRQIIKSKRPTDDPITRQINVLVRALEDTCAIDRKA